MDTNQAVADRGDDVFHSLQELLFPLLAESDSIAQGLKNLNSLPEFNLKSGIIKQIHEDDRVERGIIGFRRNGGRLELAVAGGIRMVHYLPLNKYVALIENMHLGQSANIVVQNSKNEEKDKRPQIIARLDPRRSAIRVVQGVAGRPIGKGEDLVLNDAYYIPREELTCYYLAAKLQQDNGGRLEDLIMAHDGFKGYSINIDALNPVG